jgi:hypothetical protein
MYIAGNDLHSRYIYCIFSIERNEYGVEDKRMTGFELTTGGFLIAALIAIFLASFFMWIGAKIARVGNATFGRSIVAAVGSGFITWLVSIVFDYIPETPFIIGFIVGLFLTIIIIKAAYSTSFGKALLVWIFGVIAEIIALLLALIVISAA